MMKQLRPLAFLLLLVSTVLASTLSSAQPAAPDATTRLYLPLAVMRSPSQSPFGIQTNSRILISSSLQTRAQQLGAKWVRLDTISWRKVQPTRGAAYDWTVLSNFEQELFAANNVGLTAVAIVNDSPNWATINTPWPTTCGAIRADRFSDFAAFMNALVQRYSKPPFNLHHWEMGNEPDVDPAFVPADAVWGCWGNRTDPYYGGEHYGNMLKAVSPTMRAADPTAKIWLGGLLLNTYNTTDPSHGRPEKFLEGILRAGAAPHFDVIPYHAHFMYQGRFRDHSGLDGGWTPFGGPARGKPTYLRQILALYGVNKTLVLNEAALGVCDTCNPSSDFYQAQADHVARAFVRTLAEGVDSVYWFTLDGPSWRYSGLVDNDPQRTPKPAFYAYQTLIRQLRGTSTRPTAISYVPGLEAYRFNASPRVVDVLWAPSGGTYTIAIPANKLIRAVNRDGQPITPQIVNGEARINVGFSAVYIQRFP